MSAAPSCPKTGKRTLTKDQARKEAAWWKRERFARMHWFRCKNCGGYHVGNARIRPRSHR